MTRLWSRGQQIDVVQDEQGIPTAFTWQGQRHGVVELTQQWHVDVGWWRDHAWRAYYKLSTNTGMLVVVYQELSDGGGWYLQRLYD